MSGKVGTALFNNSAPTFRKLMTMQRYCETLSIYKMSNVELYFPKAIEVDQIPYSSNKRRASNQHHNQVKRRFSKSRAYWKSDYNLTVTKLKCKWNKNITHEKLKITINSG